MMTGTATTTSMMERAQDLARRGVPPKDQAAMLGMSHVGLRKAMSRAGLRYVVRSAEWVGPCAGSEDEDA